MEDIIKMEAQCILCVHFKMHQKFLQLWRACDKGLRQPEPFSKHDCPYFECDLKSIQKCSCSVMHDYKIKFNIQNGPLGECYSYEPFKLTCLGCYFKNVIDGKEGIKGDDNPMLKKYLKRLKERGEVTDDSIQNFTSDVRKKAYIYGVSKGNRQGTHLLSQQMGAIPDNTVSGSGGSRHGEDISTQESCPVKISVEILHANLYKSVGWEGV